MLKQQKENNMAVLKSQFDMAQAYNNAGLQNAMMGGSGYANQSNQSAESYQLNYANQQAALNQQTGNIQQTGNYRVGEDFGILTKRQSEEKDLLLTNQGLISLKQEMKRVRIVHELELIELQSQYEMLLALLRKPLEDL